MMTRRLPTDPPWPPPSFHMHLPSSTVTLAGRRFPAAALVCPPGPTHHDESVYQRTLSFDDTAGYVYIPCENGLLMVLAYTYSTTTLELSAVARTCYLDGDRDPFWLPCPLFMLNKRVCGVPAAAVTARLLRTSWLFWTDAEPEWAAEQVDRLSRAPYDEPPGPRVTLISLAEADDLRRTQGTRGSHP